MSARGDDLPAYYINLATRPDRRAFMETQLDALGLGYHRIDAVTIEQIPAELAATCTDTDAPWRINLPTLACALSHRRAWQAIVESGRPAGIVFEDDVVMAPSLADCFAPDILDAAGAPLLRLETFGSRVRFASRRTPLPGGQQSAGMISTQPGAAAYVISRELARRSLADPASCTMEIDRYLFGRGGRWLLETPIAQAMPAPCIQLGNRRGGEMPPLGRSDISVVPVHMEQSRRARQQRAQANRRYVLHVLAKLFVDPAALVRPKLAVAFAGDL